jgi:Ca-activated chloride channel family protein
VKVAYQGFDAYDVEPATIPDVMAEPPIVIHRQVSRGIPARRRFRVTGATGHGSFAQIRCDPADGIPVSDSVRRRSRYLWRARNAGGDLSLRLCRCR